MNLGDSYAVKETEAIKRARRFSRASGGRVFYVTWDGGSWRISDAALNEASKPYRVK